MNIPQEALDAAERELIETVEVDQPTSWASDMPDYYRVGEISGAMEFHGLGGSVDIGHIVEVALTAALPHLREQIAREVEAIPNNYPAGPRNIWAKAITTAARIVRGEP